MCCLLTTWDERRLEPQPRPWWFLFLDGMGPPGPCRRWQSAATSVSAPEGLLLFPTELRVCPQDRREAEPSGRGTLHSDGACCWRQWSRCLSVGDRGHACPPAYSEVTCAALCQCCSESPRRVHRVTQARKSPANGSLSVSPTGLRFRSLYKH